MVPFRVSFATLGCKLNYVDTEEMQETVVRAGFSVVPFGDAADFTVINTCTVTGKSDFKSRRLISKARRSSPDVRIVVTGCYAQLDPEVISGLRGVSAVLNLGQQADLPRILLALLPEHSRSDTETSSGGSTGIRTHTRLSRAFIRVQQGCDNRCTFCRVWQARGPSRSEPVERILTQTRLFLEQGFQELVITGVDMGSWGKDLNDAHKFSDLLERIATLPGRFRIRLSSIYPMDIDPRTFELLTSHSKVCRHLHLPLQSGSPTVLRRMGRHMSPDSFLDLTWRLRETAGQFGIGADLIAGFPGETAEDFARTCDLVRRSAITYLHVFPFSARRGTAAAGFPDRLPPSLIKERAAELRRLGEEKRALFSHAHQGERVEVLVEKRRLGMGLLTGFTSDYLRADFDGPDSWMGTLHEMEFPTRSEDEYPSIVEAEEEHHVM